MKKIYYSLFAAVAMMFVTTSCSQDDVIGNEASDAQYVTASFNVISPEGINSRAIGDGSTVNKVVCATFDSKGAEMVDLRQVKTLENKKAKYSIRLVKGQNYRVAFFAYYDANGDDIPEYYDIKDLKNIVIKDKQYSNIEGRDAFTANFDIETGATMQPINQDITLYRPFAQLNLGSYKDDWDAAVKAGVTISKTKVIVSNVYKTFSAYNDAVVGETSEMTFDLNDIRKEDLLADIDNNGKDEEYKYLSMNYLLVGDKKSEMNLTDVKFVWETADGKTNNPVTEFSNIPVQRNWRTNIIGWLLTNPAEFNITIDHRFDNDYNIIAINGTVNTEDIAKSGYTDYIDEGTTEVDVIENVHIKADGTAIVVDDVKAASGTLLINNSIIDAKTFIELNDYVTIIVKDSYLNVDDLIKINTNYTAHNFIFDNCYVNGKPMRAADKSEYFSNEFLSLNTVYIYFTKDSESNEGGNTGEGNEGEGGNTGEGNEGEGGNTGEGNEGEGGNENQTVNFSDIFAGLANSTDVENAKYLSNVNYSAFILDYPGEPKSLHIANSTFGTFKANTGNVTLFLENVNFTDEVDLSAMTENFILYVENCTVKGTKVTSANVKSLMKYQGSPIAIY